MISEIIKIYKNVFPPHLRIPTRLIRNRIRRKKYIVNIIADGDKIDGFTLVQKFNKIYHLDYIAVNKNSQGKGIGGKLLKYLISKYKHLTLECEDNLVDFYSKYGFVDSKISYIWNRHKLNFMVRNVKIKTLSIFNESNIIFVIQIIYSKNDENGSKPIVWFDKHNTWDGNK